MAGLRDQIVTFIAALRDGGVRISVAESIDAVNAISVVGLERERMREGLAAALIKDEADRSVFDESFERFFAMPRAARGAHPDQRGEQVSAGAGRGKPGNDPSPLDDAPVRKPDDPREGAGASRRDEKSQAPDAKHPKKGSATRREGAAHEDDRAKVEAKASSLAPRRR